MSGGASAVMAAAVARRRREILKSFRDAGATSPDRAVPEARIDHRGHLIFRRMRAAGVIVALPDGRLWLDEAAEARSQRRRLIALTIVLLIGVVVVAVIAIRFR